MNEIYPIEIIQGETREKGEVLILEEKMDKDSSSLINDTLYLNSKTNKFQMVPRRKEYKSSIGKMSFVFCSK